MLVDIPAAKRSGLDVDVERLARDGDGWLKPEDRYALKMHGVCAQGQPGAFMLRIRTSCGRLTSAQARTLAAVAARHGRGWVHLTTRQQVEIHHVDARSVPAALAELSGAGLMSRSTCGHTVRGVMCCPDAGAGIDEPFDCWVDAKAVVEHVLANAAELDAKLPQRLNVLFGGCGACRDHAKTNDAGFVSVVSDEGRLGYELWLAGSLGKSAPQLARRVAGFVPREHVLAATQALLDVFIAHGNFEQPQKARLKFVVRDVGGFERFTQLYLDAFDEARRRTWPDPVPLPVPVAAPVSQILAQAPGGGWGSGFRPQRLPGRALATIRVPLGDLGAAELNDLASIADEFADERICLTLNQNVLLRHVEVRRAAALRGAVARVGLGLEDPDHARDVRACTAAPVCSLAITPAPAAASQVLDSPALARNSSLRVSISGCPNACAQHQVADIGLSGGKVTVGGRSVLGYQVWLGGDLRRDRIGRVAGRIAQTDVPHVTEAIVGAWEALRGRDERFSDTLQRIGDDAFAAHIAAVFRGRWEPGPEPQDGVG